MIIFHLHNNPLGRLKQHIADLEKSIPSIKVNHSEGRHGSDKGCCEWCGIVNPNQFCQCDKATNDGKERRRMEVAELKKLYKIIGKSTKSQQKLIFKYLNITSL